VSWIVHGQLRNLDRHAIRNRRSRQRRACRRPPPGKSQNQHHAARRRLRPPRESCLRFRRRGRQRRQSCQAPVKVVWTREDDLAGGWYRPMWHDRFAAGLDAQGHPIAWTHTIVGQSIMQGTPFEQFTIKEGVDSTSVEGAADLLYGIPNLQVDLHSPKIAVPVQWWRSVGHSHTGFPSKVSSTKWRTPAEKIRMSCGENFLPISRACSLSCSSSRKKRDGVNRCRPDAAAASPRIFLSTATWLR